MQEKCVCGGAGNTACEWRAGEAGDIPEPSRRRVDCHRFLPDPGSGHVNRPDRYAAACPEAGRARMRAGDSVAIISGGKGE